MSSVAVAGAVAQRAGYGGHVWAFVQYLLGFRRLGYDVLFIDHLAKDMATDRSGRPSARARARCIELFVKAMSRAGVKDSYTLLLDGGNESVGLSRPQALEQLGDCEFLLNVMGFIKDEEVLSAARRRVFLDIDPGFGQMWRQLGLADPFQGHDDFVTIAENIGKPSCSVPTCDLPWVTTRPPIDLESWSPAEAGDNGFTTVASWRGPYGPVEYKGRSYGLRAHEFRRFAELPRLSGERFEVALDIDDSDYRDMALLRRGGWELIDPVLVAGGADDYMQYIRDSHAEVMIAKQMYVATRGGWFSDRSACYLASGKPVLAQDTGFADNYPAGEGLLSFTNLEEAVAGVSEIRSDWERHSTAARAIAEERLDSRKVLGDLLGDLGVT